VERFERTCGCVAEEQGLRNLVWALPFVELEVGGRLRVGGRGCRVVGRWVPPSSAGSKPDGLEFCQYS